MFATDRASDLPINSSSCLMTEAKPKSDSFTPSSSSSRIFSGWKNRSETAFNSCYSNILLKKLKVSNMTQYDRIKRTIKHDNDYNELAGYNSQHLNFKHFIIITILFDAIPTFRSRWTIFLEWMNSTASSNCFITILKATEYSVTLMQH